MDTRAGQTIRALIQSIHYEDEDLKMSPGGKLSEREIAVLTQWVAIGVPDPQRRREATGNP